MEIEERLGRLAMISKEGNEVLKDLKDNVLLFASLPHPFPSLMLFV